jgi:hypothetical protein
MPEGVALAGSSGLRSEDPMKKRQPHYIERTLRHCRKTLGHHADKSERWLGVPGGHGKRRDLFWGVDVCALDGLPGVLGIQVCGESGVSSHRKKFRELVRDWNGYGAEGLMSDQPHPLVSWLRSGNRLAVWSWRQRPKQPGGRWELREFPLTEADLLPMDGS